MLQRFCSCLFPADLKCIYVYLLQISQPLCPSSHTELPLLVKNLEVFFGHTHMILVNTEGRFDPLNCPFGCSWWYFSFEEQKQCHLKTLQLALITCLSSLFNIWLTSENNGCWGTPIKHMTAQKYSPKDLSWAARSLCRSHCSFWQK